VTTRVLAAGLAAGAAALATTLPVLAYNRVDKLDPVLSGRGYVYYVKELDTASQPIAGRTVTMAVGTVPGAGASVAPADASGHTTGNAGPSTSVVSGPDGLAYFVLHTSPTPGQNEFLWHDADFTGQVLVQGTPHGVPTNAAAPASVGPPSKTGPTLAPTAFPTLSATSPAATHPPVTPRPDASAAAGAAASAAKPSSGGGSHPGGGAAAAASLNAGAAGARLPGGSVPPIAAALVAAGLVWLVLPGVLKRRLAVRPRLRSSTGRVASGHAGVS
jgi:hypothetical protein